jgi:hypothetical protein
MRHFQHYKGALWGIPFRRFPVLSEAVGGGVLGDIMSVLCKTCKDCKDCKKLGLPLADCCLLLPVCPFSSGEVFSAALLCKDCKKLSLALSDCCLILPRCPLSSGVFSAALSISRTGLLFFPLSFLEEEEPSSESDERTPLLEAPFCRGCGKNDMPWCLLIPESLKPSEQYRNVSIRLRTHVSQVLVTPLEGLGCGRSFRNTTLALLIM